MNSFFRQYARYFALIAITIVLLLLLFALRQFLLPFIVGIAFAYILLPLVRFIEKRLPGNKTKVPGFRRIIAVIIACLVALAVIGLVVYFIVYAVANTSIDIINNASHLIDEAIARIQDWASSVGAGLPESWQDRMDGFAASIGDMVDNAIQELFANSGGIITSSLGVIFSFAALPLFLFYLLKDAERLKTGVFGSLSPRVANHALHVFSIIERTLGRYIRAQLILGIIVAFMTFVGLLFIKPSVAVPLALINGFFEMIPTIGPIIGGTIMAIVILAVAPDMVIWAVVLAVVVQLLENNLLVPRVQAATLRLHPAVVLFLLVMGSFFWGFWGLVFIVPIVATFVDVFKYVHAMGGKRDTDPPEPLLDSAPPD